MLCTLRPKRICSWRYVPNLPCLAVGQGRSAVVVLHIACCSFHSPPNLMQLTAGLSPTLQLKHLRTQLDTNKKERERLEQSQQTMQQELQAAQAEAQQLGSELSKRRSQEGGAAEAADAAAGAATSEAYVTLIEEVCTSAYGQLSHCNPGMRPVRMHAQCWNARCWTLAVVSRQLRQHRRLYLNRVSGREDWLEDGCCPNRHQSCAARTSCWRPRCSGCRTL